MSDASTNPSVSPHPPENLDHRLVHGIAWTAVIKWLGQILSWASTLIVARLLTPEDYGLVGMALVYLGLISMLSEFGLGASLIIYRQARSDQIAQLNSVAVLFGVGCLATSLLAAKPLGAFFDSAALPSIVMVMSFGFLIAGFETVPFGLLERDLRFKLIAGMEAVTSIITSIGTVLFALLGFRYWSLVLAGLLHTGVSALLTLFYRRQRFAQPHWRTVQPLVRLGSHVLTSRLSFYVYSTADFLVVGKMLGETALGAYTLGWTLASVPVEKFAAMVGNVTAPVFSAVQKQPGELRRYLLSVTEGLALIGLPLAWGLAVVAPDFVLSVLGDKWSATILPLQVLAAYAAFRCITPLLSQVLNVTGHTRFAMQIGVVSAVVLPVGFVIGSQWGTVGVAAAWAIVHPLVLIPAYVRCFRVIELRASAYLRCLWPAVSAGALMVGAVLGLGSALPEAWPTWLHLGVKVATGASTYVLALGLFHRHRLLSAIEIVRMLRSGGDGEPGPEAGGEATGSA